MVGKKSVLINATVKIMSKEISFLLTTFQKLVSTILLLQYYYKTTLFIFSTVISLFFYVLFLLLCALGFSAKGTVKGTSHTVLMANSWIYVDKGIPLERGMIKYSGNSLVPKLICPHAC